MKNTLLVVVAVLLAAVLLNRRAVEAQQRPAAVPAGVQRWEYAKFVWDPGDEGGTMTLWTGGEVYGAQSMAKLLGGTKIDDAHIDQPLTLLGRAGWEAVTVLGNASESLGRREILFKRPAR